MQEVAQSLEDNYKLDLAFFFSEPVVNSLNQKTQTRVSFYDEIMNIMEKIEK